MNPSHRDRQARLSRVGRGYSQLGSQTMEREHLEKVIAYLREETFSETALRNQPERAEDLFNLGIAYFHNQAHVTSAEYANLAVDVLWELLHANV